MAQQACLSICLMEHQVDSFLENPTFNRNKTYCTAKQLLPNKRNINQQFSSDFMGKFNFLHKMNEVHLSLKPSFFKKQAGGYLVLSSNAGEDLKGAKKQLKLLARLKTFADATLTGAGGGAPLLALVRKLLASLAAVENLPIPAAPPSSLSAGYRYSSTYGFGALHAVTVGQLPQEVALCMTASLTPFLEA